LLAEKTLFSEMVDDQFDNKYRDQTTFDPVLRPRIPAVVVNVSPRTRFANMAASAVFIPPSPPPRPNQAKTTKLPVKK
jgi:hypothetical protein